MHVSDLTNSLAYGAGCTYHLDTMTKTEGFCVEAKKNKLPVREIIEGLKTRNRQLREGNFPGIPTANKLWKNRGCGHKNTLLDLYFM